MKRFVTLAALAAAALNAADEPLPEVLRALENLGSASGARPSEDSREIAFVTTLFGSRQAAVMPLDGGYPLQLTAEPGGIVAVRWSPTDPHALVAVALRGTTPPPSQSAAKTTAPLTRAAPVVLEEALRGLAAVGPVSPDGRTLLVQTRRRGNEVIWTVDLANARADPLTPHEGTGRFRLPRWSADG